MLALQSVYRINRNLPWYPLLLYFWCTKSSTSHCQTGRFCEFERKCSYKAYLSQGWQIVENHPNLTKEPKSMEKNYKLQTLCKMIIRISMPSVLLGRSLIQNLSSEYYKHSFNKYFNFTTSLCRPQEAEIA